MRRNRAEISPCDAGSWAQEERSLLIQHTRACLLYQCKNQHRNDKKHSHKTSARKSQHHFRFKRSIPSLFLLIFYLIIVLSSTNFLKMLYKYIQTLLTATKSIVSNLDYFKLYWKLSSNPYCICSVLFWRPSFPWGIPFFLSKITQESTQRAP